jgi:hypothetical protein
VRASKPANSAAEFPRREGFHPEAGKVTSVLKSIGFQGDFSILAPPPGEQPYLVVHIQTPAGPRQLRTPRSVSLRLA